MEVQNLIHKHNVQIRVLNQIDHFQTQKSIAESTLEVLPDCMRKTSKAYKNKIKKYSDIIQKLNKSYSTL